MECAKRHLNGPTCCGQAARVHDELFPHLAPGGGGGVASRGPQNHSAAASEFY
jgi:hypothetical protein